MKKFLFFCFFPSLIFADLNYNEISYLMGQIEAKKEISKLIEIFIERDTSHLHKDDPFLEGKVKMFYQMKYSLDELEIIIPHE